MFDKVAFPPSAEEKNIEAYKFLLEAFIHSDDELKEEAQDEYKKYFDDRDYFSDGIEYCKS